MNTMNNDFALYAGHWKCCAIDVDSPVPRRRKAPKGKDWNTLDRALTPAQAARERGIGIMHALNSPITMAFDIDNREEAARLLADEGIDLDALANAPDAVMIQRGHPNKLKLLYTLDAPLAMKQVGGDGEAGMAYELRCSNQNGTSVQDILPGSPHPDGGTYEWKFGADVEDNAELLGVPPWTLVPSIPSALRAHWQNLIDGKKVAAEDSAEDSAVAEPHVSNARREIGEADIAALLIDLKMLAVALDIANTSEPEWREFIVAAKFISGAHPKVCELIHEVSATSTVHDYSREETQKKWDYGKLEGEGARLTTMGKFKQRFAEKFGREFVGTSWLLDDGAGEPGSRAFTIEDFYAYSPEHKYLCVPTRALWPATSIDERLPAVKKVKASRWLGRHRALDQITWWPGAPQVIRDKVLHDGGWVDEPGAAVFNMYLPPQARAGVPAQAGPWVDHLRNVYPDEWEHLVRWLAHRVQRPGEKINHALVLGGNQGIGKDTLLEPVKYAVGAWNFKEVSPAQVMGRFNGFVKCVILRVSEARDLGEANRFKFYDHSKTLSAAPPDVLMADEKNIREHPVVNVLGPIITTNHLTDGIYIHHDDRRHFVAWSRKRKEEFKEGYWNKLWGWYASGGLAHVAAYLAQPERLEGFDPKAPPPQTEAWHAIVNANRAPEDTQLTDVIEALGSPVAVTLGTLAAKALTMNMGELAEFLTSKGTARNVPHRLSEAGYSPIRNTGHAEGRWRVAGRSMVIYGTDTLPLGERVAAARALAAASRGAGADASDSEGGDLV